MKTLLLDKQHHDRSGFDCGVDALNNYLKMMTSQQAGKDNTRTYVLEDAEKTGVIIGYYTLTMTQVDLTRLPVRLQKRHQRNRSAGLIARLAVDLRYAGKGYGEFLLVDGVLKLLQASEVVAFPFVLVDAKDGVAGFYEGGGKGKF